MRGKWLWMRRTMLSAAAAVFATWLLLYAPTPFVVYEPGVALPVSPMVSLQGGAMEGDAGFLLMAIRLTEPKWWQVAQAAFNSDRDLFWRSQIFRGASKSQYIERLTTVMEGSRNDALEAAYRFSGIPYTEQTEAIVVARISAAEPSSAFFMPGDYLVGLEGEKPFGSLREALEQLKAAAGGAVGVVVRRNGVDKAIPLHLPSGQNGLSWTDKELASLLGVTQFTEVRAIVPEDASRIISIQSGEIGGPSAGLVFALQTVSLLAPKLFDGSGPIAVTGTMAAQGNVGAVGGIKQKTVAAHEKQAMLFIVPKANEREAQKKAAQLKSAMRVIGVSTLEEAVQAVQAAAGRQKAE